MGPGPLNALKRQRDRSGGGAGPGRKRKDQSLKVTAAGGLDGQDPTMLLYQVRHMCHICHIRHKRHIRHVNREAYHDLTNHYHPVVSEFLWCSQFTSNHHSSEHQATSNLTLPLFFINPNSLSTIVTSLPTPSSLPLSLFLTLSLVLAIIIPLLVG